MAHWTRDAASAEIESLRAKLKHAHELLREAREYAEGSDDSGALLEEIDAALADGQQPGKNDGK